MPDIGLRQLGPSDRLQALIVTGHTDIHHDWRTISPMLRDLLKETGLFDVRITEEFRGAGPETLEPYDLVVLNYFGRFEPWSRAPEQRWGTRAEQALYDYVAAGYQGWIVFESQQSPHPAASALLGGYLLQRELLPIVSREDVSTRA